MSRRTLRPACLRQVDARTLADEFIATLERASSEEKIDSYLAEAEAASAWLTPTVIGSTFYQKIWRTRFFTQTLELSTARVVEQLLRTLCCGFIDVGAHVGYFSILAGQAGAASITAIEMHKPNWRLLQANVPSANHVLAALGEAPAEVEYYIGRGHSNHSLSPRSDTSKRRAVSKVVTLDSLVNHLVIDGFTLAKIDVQGHEHHVLRGFQSCLQSGRPIIIFEVERNDGGPGIDAPYVDAFRLLWDFKYRILSIQDRELVEIESATDPLLGKMPISSNVVAVAASRFGDFDEALHRRAI